MRICLFTPNFLPRVGGAERNADLLARGLQSLGHDVMVLAQRGDKQDHDPIVPYPVRWYQRPPAQHHWPEALCWPLYKAHRQFHFDVCLAFYSYPTGYAASLLKRKLRFGLVVSPRGGDLHEDAPLLEKGRGRSTTIAGYRAADRIVAISHWMIHRLKQVAGESLPPWEVVHNGTDQDELAALRDAARTKPPALDVRTPFVLHLARLHRVKGHAILLDALPLVADLFRSKKITYCIVGDGVEMDALKQGFVQRGVSDIVTFLGQRIGVQKAWLMDNAIMNVTTSLQEALGSVLVECISLGLPMLASDIPAHRELIDNRTWALTYRSSDARDFADKLRDMLERDLTPMRQAALDLSPEYSLHHMLKRYEHACSLAMQDSQQRHSPRKPA
jgi:glycosyltransferase involved in cell wall biosynthesis